MILRDNLQNSLLNLYNLKSFGKSFMALDETPKMCKLMVLNLGGISISQWDHEPLEKARISLNFICYSLNKSMVK